MLISAKTKISKLIEHNEKTIDIIGSINKHFRKLKNPLLRRALAPRVNIAEAARIGGVPVCVMIDKLKEIGFETADDCGCETVLPKDKYRLDETKINMRKETIEELDVRPILAGGTDPFDAIMAKLKTMHEKHTLKIINTFEPIPLLNILKKKGYVYVTERPEEGVVWTYMEKADEHPEAAGKTETESDQPVFEEIETRFTGKMKEIDVRHLEMPLPMVTILEEIEGLKEGEALYVHHKKLPQYLLPELEERNFKWASQDIDESNIKLIIFK
ncbi:MAG: hypothetical protein DRJ02_11250 [Bacteroidetes bacterium]|nr:MAG: hypothetical protein DRJ02_11250 [Bacteroidota bacterium]